MGVAAIVLGAGHREAITEAVELLGVDGKDHKAMLQQHLDHWAVRRFDCHRDLSRRSLRLLKQPATQVRQSSPAMHELALTNRPSLGIKQADAMALRCPVDPDEPLYVIDHCWDLLALCGPTAILIDPCTGALGANLLSDLDRGRSARARVLRRCSWHRWVRPLPADQPEFQSTSTDWFEPQNGTGWVERSETHRGHECDDGYRFAPPILRTLAHGFW